MDDSFFNAFNADLHNKEAWHEFHTSYKKGKGKLKDAATQNPSVIGDPVSMIKPENAGSEPTDQDRGARPSSTTASAPKASSSNSSIPLDAPAPTPTSLTSEKTTTSSYPSLSSQSSSTPPLPELPKIDGKALFWQIMDHSRTPDQHFFPALLRLKAANTSQRPILGALSNSVIFPPGHPYNRISSVPASSESTPSSPSSSPASQSFVSKDDDPRSNFDVFIASAEVGMRKPEKRIYELALRRLDEFDRKKGGTGVRAEDVLFLDDIGENLRTARELGMRTIKVQIGKTFRAVKELEKITGLELMDETTRRAKL